jgi:hypothetical protein
MARFTVTIPRRERILFKVRKGLRQRQWYVRTLCSSCGLAVRTGNWEDQARASRVDPTGWSAYR